MGINILINCLEVQLKDKEWLGREFNEEKYEWATCHRKNEYS